MRFAFTIFMSVFFLFIFSFVMKSSTTGVAQPLNYLISGIIIMTVFQSALNNSTNILEDISMGYMKEIIVSPVARWQISIGQIISSSIIATIQGFIVILMALFMGLRLNILQFIEMSVVMTGVGFTFGAMGLYMATVARNSQTFQILMTLITMPLTFLSGAYIPTTVMPSILKPIVFINPLTYTTAIFRYITLNMHKLKTAALLKSGVAFNINGYIMQPYMGLVVIAGMCLLFFLLSVRQFNRADFSQVKVFKHD